VRGNPAGGKLVKLIYHVIMPKLAVFFTVYDRFENFYQSMRAFKNQINKDFDLYVVNNSSGFIDDMVEELDVDCTVINLHNERNIYGRFFAVKAVLKKGYEAVAFMDDDIIFPPDYTQRCINQYDPRYIKSFWAFQIADDYWTRKKLHRDQNGHYAGAGGLLAPIDFFRVPQLYECPEEYWIMDDIWMSHVVLAYTKYKIRIFSVPIVFLDDKKATYKKIREEKREMAKEYLIPYR